MRIRWWHVVLGIVGLVILVVVVGVVLLSVQDVNKFKDLLARKVSEKTGRELTIAGNFDLSISFSPSITADNVTFENAAWGTRPEMLKLGHVEAKVALFPMLSGDIEIERLILEDMDLLAETNADGVGNWVFGDKDGDKQHEDSDDDADGGLPVIDDLRIENALLRYRDGQTGERHVVMIAHADADGGGASGGNFALQGVWNNSPIDAAGTIGPGDEDVALAVVIEMFGAKTEMLGTVGELGEFEGVALHIRVAGEKLSDLNLIAGSLPSVGPYALQADLRSGDDDTYILENFKAQIADNDLAGRLEFSSGERPRLTADLTSARLDLDALLAKNDGAAPAAGTDASGDDATGEAGASPEDGAPERVFPDEPLDFAALDEADARVSLKVSELRYRGLSLRGAELGLELEQGVLRIEPVQAGLGDGDVVARIELQSRTARPELQLELKLIDVGLAAIKPLFDLSDIITGPLDLEIALAGQGRSAHEIASTLGGRIDLVVGAGTIPNAYVDLIAADLLRFIVPGGEGNSAQLNCFVARFDVKDGVALNQALLFDTALTTTAGKGQIDLGRELADLTVVPRPKDPSLLSLAIPVVIDGPLLDLSYNLKKEEALLGLAASVAGTVLMGPFGILIPLVSTGSGDDNPCLTALEQPAQNEQGATETPAKSTAPAEAVEDVLDNVLGIFD